MLLVRLVELPPGDARADPRLALLRVDLDRLQPADIDDEAVLDQRVAGHAVPAGAHRERKVVVPSEADGRGNVLRPRHLGDRRGARLDHRVE